MNEPNLPAGARVFIISAYDDAEPIGTFRKAVAADKHGRHRLVDTAADADFILFIENSRYHYDPFFRQLRNHPLVRLYPDKSFMYNPHDKPWLVLPGLYPCIATPLLNTARIAASPYIEKVNEHIYYDLDAEPKLLYSFYGNVKMPVRRELPGLQHPRGLIKTWTTGLYRDDKPVAPQLEYADLLANSKFILCPRGLGPSSVRLFETMQAGRVPVIISDDWARPWGPAWDELAVFVPEGQIAQIPRMLEEAEARWPEMARRARAAWEEFFAPETIFHYCIEQLVVLKSSRERVQLLLPLYHKAQFAKWYFRVKVLIPAKIMVTTWRQK